MPRTKTNEKVPRFSPRALLERAINAAPQGPDTKWYRYFCATAKSDERWLIQILEDVFAYELSRYRARERAVESPRHAPKLTPRLVRRAQKARQQLITAAVTAARHHVWWDYLLPGGKALHACTGAEVLPAGGFLTHIGQIAGMRRVETVWSAATLQDEFKKWTAAQTIDDLQATPAAKKTWQSLGALQRAVNGHV